MQQMSARLHVVEPHQGAVFTDLVFECGQSHLYLLHLSSMEKTELPLGVRLCSKQNVEMKINISMTEP